MDNTFSDWRANFGMTTASYSKVSGESKSPPNTNPQIAINPSQTAIDKMAIDNNDAWNKSLLMSQDYQQKLDLNNQKAQLQMRHEETIEKNRENRELESVAAFENENGFICIMKCNPGRKPKPSPPLINALHLKAIHIVDIDDIYRIYVITWDGHGFEVIQNNARAFSKRLDELGIPILVGRDRKLSVAEAILGFLNSKAETRKMHRFKGWNMTEKGWHFVEENEQTIDDIIREEGL